ncbi:type II toxin-antitoxin system RelE/ParE family toxin [Stieleria sp. ICT_E10.1]|uniref:type II toxin-antitoxin system RelE/ParE family toxin n=1 Tax=Stieleria sedimenti TaxID=2976331 RepID=UPI00217F56D8|nr:type II toxin-antitoxin system RelE/ParE family toxin [Stieleria sedimenti]MCS7470595.1 type II toxin-antitoxin system RelE/ParE family toxin [Stieleria sedimenti]
MSSKKPRKLALTQAALASINEIEQYSIENWGKKAAARDIDDLEAGLIRIQEQPDLLLPRPEFSSELCFYRVNKHLFVCDLQKASIIVLAVIHASQDIPERLAELEPTLAKEIELLHKKLQAAERKR